MSATDDTRLAMGIRQPSDYGTYMPLWCGALDSTTPTIMGNVEASEATTVSAKLYVDGNSFTTGYAGAFTSQVYGISNQIVSQHNATGTTTSINIPQPSSNRIYTITNIGADSDFVMTNGTQTLNSKVLTSTGNITMNTGAVLETNDIVSKTGADISIDAVGDQRINFGTLSNLGTRFTTAATDNWAAEFRNNTAADFNTSSGSYVRVSNFLYGGTDNLGDFMSNLFVAYSADGGFLVSIRLQDVTNSQTIAESASFASGGSNQILTLSSFSNIPTGPAIFELQCSTQTTPDITIHSASLQL
eukprot:gene5004-8602_t